MSGTVHQPDCAAMCRHLELLALPVNNHGALQVEIAWGAPDAGPNRARLFAVSCVNDAVAFAASVNREGCNVYVGATLKKSDTPRDRRTGNQHAAIATCLAIDIDSDLVAGVRNLPVKPRLLVVTGMTPSARGHIWIGINPTSDLNLWDEATVRAVALCNGDMGARGRSRVMRLGGSVSYPSASKTRRGYKIELVAAHTVGGPSYDLAALTNILSPSPWATEVVARPQRPQCPRTRSAPNSQDVLAALAALPASYAEEHDLWIRVGFALHDFDPGPAGLQLWKEFSRRCPEEAAVTNFEQRWASFGRQSGRPMLTTRWLFAQARDHGWRRTGGLAHRTKAQRLRSWR